MLERLYDIDGINVPLLIPVQVSKIVDNPFEKSESTTPNEASLFFVPSPQPFYTTLF